MACRIEREFEREWPFWCSCQGHLFMIYDALREGNRADSTRGAHGANSQEIKADAIEARRLEVLRSYALLDSPAEESFDRITRLAARTFGVPVALISLLDENRQWFKSRVGLEVCQTGREEALCALVVESDAPLVVPDTHRDARFTGNSLVTGPPHIRFYAGAPLRVPEGATLGTLCLIDTQPREFSPADLAQLSDLAAMVVDEIRLRHQERLYRSLIENGSEIVTIFDASGTVTYQSPSLTRCLGYETDELIGRAVFELVHPDDREMVMTRFAGMLKDKLDVKHCLFRFQHKNGNWHTLECNGRYLLDDPQIRGIVATSRDVSDRVRIQQQLEFSESRFEATFDQSSIGIVLVGPDGQMLRANPAFAEISGYQPEQLSALNYRALLHPDDLKESVDNGEILKSGSSKNVVFERRLRHRDSHYLWAQFSVTLVRDGAARPLYFIVQIQDIDARKKQDDRLRLLESIAVHANDAILVTEAEPTDEPGPRIIYANAAYLKMSGYTLEEVIGKTPRIMQGPDTDPASRATIRKALKRWKPVVVELLNYTKDGTPFWVELSIVPVADEKGWFTHWVSVQRDVTARKATEAMLTLTVREAERAREEAEAANAAKSEFLGRMSHELRTPLNAILGFGQLLELEEQSPNNRESTEQILQAGRHLLELINEVLDISRIETGRMAMSLEAVSVAEIAREVLDLVRPMAAQYGIAISTSGVFDSPLWLLGDRRRIKQVMINLLSNAIKYNHAGGRVTLWSETRAINQDGKPSDGKPRVRLCVTDTGKGIAPEKRERLWVPFDRLDAETTGVEGTGIGLALSRRLAQTMGGALDFDSNGTLGSTFWLELPSATPALAALELLPGDIVPASARPATTKWVALYIEDNQPNVQLMQGILARRPEIRLLTAFQGALGLELTRQYCPDIILLDLHLPDMNGDEVLRSLRENPQTSHIPVVMVSADATPRQIERLLQLGANEYLSKPFDVNNFLEMLDNLIGKTTEELALPTSLAEMG